jgi:hypothetical protein
MRANVAQTLSTTEDTEDTEVSISDHTSDAVTQMGNIEIDQRPELIAAEFQVGESLGEIQRKQFFHGLLSCGVFSMFSRLQAPIL